MGCDYHPDALAVDGSPEVVSAILDPLDRGSFRQLPYFVVVNPTHMRDPLMWVLVLSLVDATDLNLHDHLAALPDSKAASYLVVLGTGSTISPFVDVPTVEDPAALAADLAAAGIAAAPVEAQGVVDVRGLRERLHLSHEQFTLRYGFEVETLRGWEDGRQEMDAAARSYLRAIFNAPERVEQAYAPTPLFAP